MKKILAVILAIALFASHVNVTFGTHYCGGKPVETKVILGAAHLGCGMNEMGMICALTQNNKPSTQGVDQTPCCENVFQTVQTTGEFTNDHNFQLSHIDFTLAILFAASNILIPEERIADPNYIITPPHLLKEFTLLTRVFLL